MVFDDFCSACAMADSHLIKALSRGVRAVVVACRARAVKALLQYANIDSEANGTTRVVDRRGNRGCAKLTGILDLPDTLGDVKIVNTHPKAPFWFPVIDRGRCENCGACAEFCLFGVYEKEKTGAPKVAQPGNCKDQCPACARICPVGAVIFPKFHSPPINGGEAAKDKSPATPLSSLSPEELHAALTKRSGPGKGKGLYRTR